MSVKERLSEKQGEGVTSELVRDLSKNMTQSDNDVIIHKIELIEIITGTYM